MAYLKFLKTTNIIPCVISPVGEHVVNLKFNEAHKVNLNGFDAFLDPAAEHNIGGKSYRSFRTLYRQIDDTEYQLSNDGSVYVAPVEPAIPEPTPEEIAERERQEKIASLQAELSAKEAEIADTDYIIIKLYEYSLVGKTTDEYDVESLHAKRQILRDEINALNHEIDALMAESEEDDE